MILKTLAGDVHRREASLSALLEAQGLGRTGGTAAGVNVNHVTIVGIPAANEAVTFATQAVAVLTMGVWTGDPNMPNRVNKGPAAELFGRTAPNPAQDWFGFWDTIEASLEWRNVAYYWKTKDAKGRVFMLTALHPDQVTTGRDRQTKAIVHKVNFAPGFPVPPEMTGRDSITVDTSVVRHIRGRGHCGELIPPTPVQLFRKALGTSIAKYDHEAAIYENSAMGGLAISFPPNVGKEEADRWRDGFDNSKAGPSNSGKTKVVGGGATITPIGMTQQDAQFVELARLSVLDMARIFHVPAWLLAGDSKSGNPMTPEHEQQKWVQHYLLGRLVRIESALRADPDLFPSAAIFPAFDTAGIIRGDLKTQDDIAHQQIQDGRLLVDEWRVPRGQKPLPGGVGMIPQITPVGGAPNPK